MKNLTIVQPDQVWASDITYIQLTEEFVYLAVMLDLFTRKCIGWQLGRHIDTQLTLSALNQALKQRWNPGLQNLIHHSDQGVQYASNLYIDCLKDHNFQISISRKGKPSDNAYAESFIKNLKSEEASLWECRTLENVQERIPYSMRMCITKKRLHSSSLLSASL